MAGKRNRNRPDQNGVHRGAFERNKKKIYATQTVCGICGKPVDFNLKYPHPLSPCIDLIFKIPEEVHTHPYVTDSFKNLMEQNGIKGFKFVLVWQDE